MITFTEKKANAIAKNYNTIYRVKELTPLPSEMVKTHYFYYSLKKIKNKLYEKLLNLTNFLNLENFILYDYIADFNYWSIKEKYEKDFYLYNIDKHNFKKVILKLLSAEFDKFHYNERKKKKGLSESLDYFYKVELKKNHPGELI